VRKRWSGSTRTPAQVGCALSGVGTTILPRRGFFMRSWITGSLELVGIQPQDIPPEISF
jgi:hypothetical protein